MACRAPSNAGPKGIDTLLSFALFSIFPTFFQLLLFTAIMIWKLNIWIALTTLAMVGGYVWFTFAITRWRVRFRREMNDSDSEANTKAVDSLLNYETVKYFNNEGHETRRFEKSMDKYSRASIQAQISLSVLNTGQAAIMAVGMGLVMVLTMIGIVHGQFTIGALMMGNAILMQLYQPLNLLGTVYREITQALVDMEAMFRLLYQPQEVQDKPGAKDLVVHGGEIKFDNVVFSYEPARIVLKGISFTVPAGKTVAVVGPSGAGKSTISRILYRFYDIKSGSVTIDGQDIRDVTQASLRAKSASFRRIRFCSTTPCATTSPMAGSARTNPRSRTRRAWRRSTASSRNCRSVTTRWWESAASSFPAGKSSAWRSRARS